MDPRQRYTIENGLAPLASERQGQRQVTERRDRRVGRDRAEESFDGRERRCRVDVTDDREHRVVRRVVGAEEAADVLERRRVEVVHRADRRVVVRVLGREELGLELLLERAVRTVVVRPALLVLDHLTLVVEVLLAERVEQRRHAIRLEPERELELVRWQGLEVVGPVEPGRAVHRAAGSLDERDVLRLSDVSRALEHHVLEEVGEAGLARDLVLRADVVPEVDGDDRGQVVLGDDDPQAVVEVLVAEHDLGDGGGHACDLAIVGGGGRGLLRTIVPPPGRLPRRTRAGWHGAMIRDRR
jgi:hypothetical protein